MIRYLVRSGDTLSAIAERFGTTVEAIMAANNLVNPDIIFAGHVLLIPVEGPNSSRGAVPAVSSMSDTSTGSDSEKAGGYQDLRWCGIYLEPEQGGL